MKGLLVRATLLAALAASFAAAAPACAAGPAWSNVPAADTPAVEPARGAFYCQPPAVGFSVNASSAFDSEVADGLPDSLVGRTIGKVTLYVAEWAWWDWEEPQGLVVSFYNGTCPPPLTSEVEFNLDWEELAVELLDFSPPTRIVYAATVALPSPVTITAGMSMGVSVVTDWGAAPPYTGLTMTAENSLHGCGEAYWDDETHGSARWTPLSDATGIAADLAFCLAEVGTGMETAAPVSWSRLKSLFR